MSEMDFVALQAVHLCGLCDVRNDGNEDGDEDVLKNGEPFFLVLGNWDQQDGFEVEVRRVVKLELLTLYHSNPSCC
jgi:hypothetical protein